MNQKSKIYYSSVIILALTLAVVASGCGTENSTAATASASSSVTTTAPTENSSTTSTLAPALTTTTTTAESTAEAAPEETTAAEDESSSESSIEEYQESGSITVDGDTAVKSNLAITASGSDESGVEVSSGGSLSLDTSIINKTGDTSNTEDSDFKGLNAGILAESASEISLTDVTVNTSAKGANAVFSTGDNSIITLNNVDIYTTGNSSRGLDATYNGTIIADNITITTEGDHCGALATDRGEGTITVSNATINTAGDGSPGVYSTGNITVSDSTAIATGSEAAAIEGKNSITLNNCSISGAKKWGVLIYQSFSGDAGIGTGSFIMNGGSLTAVTGPLFYSTNTDAVINLDNVELNGTGELLTAEANRWGNSGSNGADVIMFADNQTLEGTIYADSISSIVLNLENSTLTGAINTGNEAASIVLSLSSDSAWNVTGDSYITILTDDDTSLSNIISNGYNIYYDSTESENSWLNGQTYNLSGGGQLIPM